MTIEYNELDLMCARVEKSLNLPGYIPLISTVSGGFRLLAGKVMTSAAIIATVGFLIASVFDDQYCEHAKRSIDYIAHGLANVLRGSIEFIPFFNLVTLPYDASTRFTYNAELTVLTPRYQPTI